MRITLNGRECELPDGSTVADALASLGVAADERGVAAAVGEEVVARRDWERTTLDGGARVEIVRATAGG